MTEIVHGFVELISRHPHWAGVLVILVAAAESIAVVGWVVPGTAILVGVGTLVGLGHLPLWPILVWAALGAIAGDGFSYWIGHRYKGHLRDVWPFAGRAGLLDKGEAFFRRHGGYSILLGRFLPVLRPVVPVAAGILGMPPGRFYLANLLSALAWSPAHILPGALLGASLGVLGGISGRLVAVALGLLGAGLAAAWLLRAAFVFVLPQVARAQYSVVAWARRRGGLGECLVVPLLDPALPGSRTLLLLGVILVAAVAGFAKVLEDVATRDALVQADLAINHLMQSLRTPWADGLMVVLTSLGDTVVTVAVALAAIAWMVGRRAIRLAVGFALALVLATGFVKLLKLALHLPRPAALYEGAEALSFPSGHATMAAVLYGMLAWLVVKDGAGRWRMAAVAAAALLITGIAVSRVYLSAHWPSDVMAGVLLGTGLAAAFGLAFRNFDTTRLRAGALAGVAALALALAGAWHATANHASALATYALQRQTVVLAAEAWIAADWRRLPERRIDVVGETEEPMTLQWLGPPEALRDRLLAAGWREPAPWGLATLGGFLDRRSALAALPVLPRMHDGRQPALTLVEDLGAQDRPRLVLRLWETGFVAEGSTGTLPLLAGTVVEEVLAHPLGLLSVVRVAATGDRPRDALASALDDHAWGARAAPDDASWDGRVILAR